jgi:hypothetical protein
MVWKFSQILLLQQLWLILPKPFGVQAMDLNIQPLCSWLTHTVHMMSPSRCHFQQLQAGFSLYTDCRFVIQSEKVLSIEICPLLFLLLQSSLVLRSPPLSLLMLAKLLLQLAGVSVAVVLFALMRQAREWELDNSLPSIVACIGANLRLPVPFFALAVGPLLMYFSITVFSTETSPSLISFLGLSIICYIFANGAVALLAYICSAVFYTGAFCHSFIKVRYALWHIGVS